MGTTSQKQSPVKIKPIDYLVYAIYRGFEFFLKLVPLSFVCRCGEGMGYLAYHLLKKRRQTVTRNLRIAFGDTMNLDEIQSLTKKSFQTSGANLMASFQTSLYSPEKIQQCLEIEGVENLRQARKQSHGVIALLCHMGNWELLAHIHLIIPELSPSGTLYRPIDNPLIDNLIKRRRGHQGTELFSRRDGFFKPIAHIKKGGALGMLADQNAGQHGLATPFFGKLTSMTNLPAIIHRRTGASILPMAMSTQSRGKWKITILPPINITEEQKKNTQYITCACAKAYESAMRISPVDVFWMHGYWKTGTKRPLKIAGLQKKRTGLQRSLATTPFKIIVYVGRPTEEETSLMLSALKRLIHYRPDIHVTVFGDCSSFQVVHHCLKDPIDASTSEKIDLLRRYEQSQTTPIDCVLDFTPSGSGASYFKSAGYSHIFTRYGKHQSPFTRHHFSRIEHPTLHDFLTSLGMEDSFEENTPTNGEEQ